MKLKYDQKQPFVPLSSSNRNYIQMKNILFNSLVSYQQCRKFITSPYKSASSALWLKRRSLFEVRKTKQAWLIYSCYRSLQERSGRWTCQSDYEHTV